jgi:hypothetical protein
MTAGMRANRRLSAVPSRKAALTSNVAMKYPKMTLTWQMMFVTVLVVVGAYVSS